jgi:replicative DNA helicase
MLDTDLHTASRHFSELVEADPLTAIPLMQSFLARLDYEHCAAAGFGLREVAERVQEAYEGAREGTIFGIPWPWDCLTQDTLGKNPGDFIVFYGRMKSMKTWIMLISAIEDYMRHKRRVLVWSREMDEKKMSLRAGSLLAKADYQCLKRGGLPPAVHKRAMKTLHELADNMARTKEEIEEGAVKDVPDLIFMCGRRAPKTLEALEGAVQAYNPDIVYLDSFYHLECEKTAKLRSDHDRQRTLAEEIKQHALDWEIPIVGTTQANRDGEKTHGENMADVARSDAIAREADLILRILYKKGPDLFEDDYEGFWKMQEMGETEHADEKRAPGPKLRRKTKARTKIPKKIEDQFLKNRKPRKSAEIGIALSGNREGTMDAFLLKVAPGVYGWGKDVLREDLPAKELKKIFGGGGKPQGGGRRNDGVAGAGLPPTDGAEGFGDNGAGSS